MKLRSTFQSLGPGLLWAGAAIGVSHLVQSTRAGADYGFGLVWLVLAAHLFKYPFFEFGPRYAAATGSSLLSGYQKLGKWAIPLYLVVTALTMFTILAAVTVVTGSLFASVFGLFDYLSWTYLLMLASGVVVLLGNYKVLDRLVKVIILLLTLSTLFALAVAATRGYAPQAAHVRDFAWSGPDLVFLLALAGWMPSAIDISVWHSLWTLAKDQSQQRRAQVREALFDFNVGYIGTAFMALAFLSLGALMMHGTGEQFSDKAAVFAGQVVQLFTKSLGGWSYPIIALAALTTMLSTTLTVADAIPRVLAEAIILAKPSLSPRRKTMQWFWMLTLVAGASLLLAVFMNSLKVFVDVATILSFLTAPILGWMNLRAVTAADFPVQHRPATWLLGLSWVGLVVLSAFGLYYLFGLL